MDRSTLINQIREKQTFLCVGLDTDPDLIPDFLNEFEDPVFEFNKRIIDATKNHCVSYKLNIAFYEAMGAEGWNTLKRTIDYIPENILTIADAKRGDIGNTANKYAQTFFKTYDFDATTVAPYMGKDSISPFLEHEGKWTIVLGLTSNPGSAHFQKKQLADGKFLFEEVIKQTAKWGSQSNLMFVVGATQTEELKTIREIIPNHFLLIPGVGAQGGSLDEVCRLALNKDVGILINSSRGIIYASKGLDFDKAAGDAAKSIQQSMKVYLD